MYSGASRNCSGSSRLCANAAQHVSERNQTLNRNYNAGAHYIARVNPPIEKHFRRICSRMRKCKCRKIMADRNIELSIA